jgi:hypothetical protein
MVPLSLMIVEYRNYNVKREKRRKIGKIADDAGMDTF